MLITPFYSICSCRYDSVQHTYSTDVRERRSRDELLRQKVVNYIETAQNITDADIMTETGELSGNISIINLDSFQELFMNISLLNWFCLISALLLVYKSIKLYSNYSEN